MHCPAHGAEQDWEQYVFYDLPSDDYHKQRNASLHQTLLQLAELKVFNLVVKPMLDL